MKKYQGNIKEFPNMASSGGGTLEPWIYPWLGSKAGDSSKSPGHFPECDVIGGGEGVYIYII